MRLIFPLVVLSLLAVGCNKSTGVSGNAVIVTVGDDVLSRTELEAGIPNKLNPEDSIIASENFIRMWINDHLLYNIASKNISDKEKIDQLVDNYRKSLIVYQYQEKLINEKLSKEISDEELRQYYDANAEKFKLDRPLIKGLFLKIPVDAPQINKIQGWYKATSSSALESIEKYSIQNAVVYDYFFDRWVEFRELGNNLPVEYNDEDAAVKNNKYIELKDSSFYYFLNIKEYLLSGDNAPFEYIQPTIREILINQKKLDFLKKVEDDLYQTAVNKGEIIYYPE